MYINADSSVNALFQNNKQKYPLGRALVTTAVAAATVTSSPCAEAIINTSRQFVSPALKDTIARVEEQDQSGNLNFDNTAFVEAPLPQEQNGVAVYLSPKLGVAVINSNTFNDYKPFKQEQTVVHEESHTEGALEIEAYARQCDYAFDNNQPPAHPELCGIYRDSGFRKGAIGDEILRKTDANEYSNRYIDTTYSLLVPLESALSDEF